MTEYRCFECDAVFIAETPAVRCPECKAAALEEITNAINRIKVCVHCGIALENEDNSNATAHFRDGYSDWERTAFNPSRSDGLPALCRRCNWGH